jgi:hypothetical protein
MQKISASALVVASLWVSDAKAQTFTTLDVPGAVSTAASDINNNNQIVGEYFTSIGAPGHCTATAISSRSTFLAPV